MSMNSAFKGHENRSPKPSFCCFELFRGGLAGVFWITVLLNNPSVLEVWTTNRWPDVLFLYFLVKS